MVLHQQANAPQDMREICCQDFKIPSSNSLRTETNSSLFSNSPGTGLRFDEQKQTQGQSSASKPERPITINIFVLLMRQVTPEPWQKAKTQATFNLCPSTLHIQLFQATWKKKMNSEVTLH